MKILTSKMDLDALKKTYFRTDYARTSLQREVDGLKIDITGRGFKIQHLSQRCTELNFEIKHSEKDKSKKAKIKCRRQIAQLEKAESDLGRNNSEWDALIKIYKEKAQEEILLARELEELTLIVNPQERRNMQMRVWIRYVLSGCAAFSGFYFLYIKPSTATPEVFRMFFFIGGLLGGFSTFFSAVNMQIRMEKWETDHKTL